MGPSSGIADCARRSLGKAPEDPGSIPGTSTRWRRVLAESARRFRLFGPFSGGAAPRPRPRGSPDPHLGGCGGASAAVGAVGAVVLPVRLVLGSLLLLLGCYLAW